MEEEKDAFYVVRKGDVIGIYKTLHDCLAQAGFSVCNPYVTVYKGYGLPKETEEYLVSHGHKNSIYSASASDIKEDLFENSFFPHFGRHLDQLRFEELFNKSSQN